MSETWRWRCTDSAARPVQAPGAATTFPTQADAEAWLGEVWSTLREAGVDEVTLERDGDTVFGPMSLHEG